MDGQELAEREDPYRPATGPVYDTSHMRLVDSSPPTRWLGQMDAAVVQRPDQHTTYDRRSNSRSLCVRGMVTRLLMSGHRYVFSSSRGFP